MAAYFPFESEFAQEQLVPAEWDERRPPRVSDEVSVQVRTRSGHRRCRVRDLSLTGLYVEGVRAPIGRVVRMSLQLPEQPEELLLTGRVVRCEDSIRGVAMTFSRIGWEDMLSIARFLAPRL